MDSNTSHRQIGEIRGQIYLKLLLTQTFEAADHEESRQPQFYKFLDNMDAMTLAAKAETDIHRFAVDFKLVDRKYMAEKERHIKKGKKESYPEPEIYNIAATAAFKMG